MELFVLLPYGWRSAILKHVVGCASVSRRGWYPFLVVLWSAICRPKYFAGHAYGGCRGGDPFYLPCGWRSAAQNILLVAVPRGTAVPCCLPCGWRSAAMRFCCPGCCFFTLIHDETIPVRWRPGASIFAEEIALLSEQTHEANRLVRGKIRVPPTNDESQAPSGAPVCPVHVAKVCSEATSYLFLCDATKLPAATACHCLGKFGVGRSATLSIFSGRASARRGGKCYPFCSNAPAAA